MDWLQFIGYRTTKFISKYKMFWNFFIIYLTNSFHCLGFPDSSAGKESACNAGDPSSIPGLWGSAGEGIGYPLQYSWASLVAQLVKNLPAMRKTWFWSLGWEEPLENGKATHSNILAWRIPWTVESMGSQRCMYIFMLLGNYAKIVSENPSEICVCLSYMQQWFRMSFRAYLIFKTSHFVVKLLILCPFYCFSIIRPFPPLNRELENF